MLTLDEEYLVFSICHDLDKKMKFEYSRLLADRITFKLINKP